MDSTAHINTDLVSFGYSESTYVIMRFTATIFMKFFIFFLVTPTIWQRVLTISRHLEVCCYYHRTHFTVCVLTALPHIGAIPFIFTQICCSQNGVIFYCAHFLKQVKMPDSLFILNILNNFICCPIWKVLNPVLVKAMNFRHRCFQSAQKRC